MRELESLVQRLVALSTLGDLDLGSLLPGSPEPARTSAPAVREPGVAVAGAELRPYKEHMAEQERRLPRSAMEAAAGNVSVAAELPELPRRTLRSRLDRFPELQPTESGT